MKATPARTETGARHAEARKSRAEVEIDDRLVRALGIPGFGIVIPRMTGLLDGISVDDPSYWLGSLWFVLLAAAVWQANRWSLFEQRKYWGWFDYPVRKVAVLLLAIVGVTSPLTVASLVTWYAWQGISPRWPIISTVVLTIVISVIFVVHIYETVFLLRESADDRVRVVSLERARAEAELEAFRAQVDPHFLFNSLNTLGHLIATDPAGAAAFTDHLAELHRYLLRQSKAMLVSLDDELGFLADYVALMTIRFGTSLTVVVTDDGVDRAARLPPTALQLLVENAIKHNEVGEGHPLTISVMLGAQAIVVSNERRHRRTARPSGGIGLRNLDERVRLATGHRIAIDERDGRFTVSVPLAEAS